MQHPITIMGSTALSPRSPKKVTFASRTNPANHAAKVKTVAQPYPIITRPFITIRLACSLVWVYHTAWQKTTAICQNSPFFLRTCVPTMYGRTQRSTQNAPYSTKGRIPSPWWYPAFAFYEWLWLTLFLSCPAQPRFCKRCSGRRCFLGRHSWRLGTAG